MTDENYTGVTTGTVATACSLAALDAILDSSDIACVSVETPKKTLDIIIDECHKLSNTKACAVAHKNPYNDPDVTVDLEIISTVELFDKTNQKENIIITGGKGVGKITKPGLQIPVGGYAINPGPRSMIVKNLKDKIPEDKIAKITISIPEGEKIANKTMNPKLGIVGGISVLGTTGIARSMSSEAYKNSIVTQLDVALALNLEDLVFVPGNIGEKLALKQLNISKQQIIQTGNYVGFMFEEAEKRGINKFTFFGHIGKLIKVAGGIFNTKHAVADGRREIMVTHAALCGVNQKNIQRLFDSKTTDDMMDILDELNISQEVSNSIACAIHDRCLQRFNIDLNVMLVDMEGNNLNNNWVLSIKNDSGSLD
ncbi:MAG: cobalamin biosynthesis protein CbiD [Methanobrevibacter thaueri]|nr:cobalamin biosynthesis protein CbiD [Methanobrevibacter thaueri]